MSCLKARHEDGPRNHVISFAAILRAPRPHTRVSFPREKIPGARKLACVVRSKCPMSWRGQLPSAALGEIRWWRPRLHVGIRASFALEILGGVLAVGKWPLRLHDGLTPRLRRQHVTRLRRVPFGMQCRLEQRISFVCNTQCCNSYEHVMEKFRRKVYLFSPRSGDAHRSGVIYKGTRHSH